MNDDNNMNNFGKSSTGLNENLAGLLCYAFGIFSGIVFLIIEKDSRFVKFHAVQSILLTIFLIILKTALGYIPLLGWLLSLLVGPASFILWIVMMVKAYQMEWFELPVIGDIAKKQL